MQVVDCRPKGQFNGTDPDINPHINSGHMLGSTNLPFMELTNKETMTMKSPADIRKGKWTLFYKYIFFVHKFLIALASLKKSV